MTIRRNIKLVKRRQEIRYKKKNELPFLINSALLIAEIRKFKKLYNAKEVDFTEIASSVIAMRESLRNVAITLQAFDNLEKKIKLSRNTLELQELENQSYTVPHEPFLTPKETVKNAAVGAAADTAIK